MAFDAWLGDPGVADVNAPSTTFVIGAADASVTATYVSTIMYLDGDLNEDLIVDLIDLNMVLIDWGKIAGFFFSTSDADDNGTVDIVDLNMVLIDWGKTGLQ